MGLDGSSVALLLQLLHPSVQVDCTLPYFSTIQRRHSFCSWSILRWHSEAVSDGTSQFGNPNRGMQCGQMSWKTNLVIIQSHSIQSYSRLHGCNPFSTSLHLNHDPAQVQGKLSALMDSYLRPVLVPPAMFLHVFAQRANDCKTGLCENLKVAWALVTWR